MSETTPIQVFLSDDEAAMLERVGKHYNLDGAKRPGPRSRFDVSVSDTVRLAMRVTDWLIKQRIGIPDEVINNGS